MAEGIELIDGARCLVTGGAGFVGSSLVTALRARGCQVHVLDRAPPGGEQDGVRWFEGDIRNADDVRAACEGVDTIFHTAAMIETLTYAPKKFAALVWEVNVDGTHNLIQVAQSCGVRRLVQTSSMITAYGQQSTNGDESGPYSTSRDLYSSTKVAAERLVLGANGIHGLMTCAVRPGGIYGPGERGVLIGPLIQALKQGVPLVFFGDGETLLDYTYIDNLVDAQIRAAERLVEGSPVCGQAYFITDGSPINTGAFSAALVRHMGLDKPTVRVPGPVARAIATVMERTFQVFRWPKPAVSIVNAHLCEEHNYFSIDKAKRELGYVPLVNTREGLRRTAVDARAYYDSL